MFHSITLVCSTLNSIIFTQMSHLLIQTLCICLLTGFMTQSFWFSYILFLVFLGGLLVLFIYVTSLASNEMFTLSASTLFTTISLFMICALLIVVIDPLPYLISCLNTDMMDLSVINCYYEEASLSLTKLYNQPTGLITLMLVLYLFLTLIAVVKITCIFFGPLRQKN